MHWLLPLVEELRRLFDKFETFTYTKIILITVTSASAALFFSKKWSFFIGTKTSGSGIIAASHDC